MTDMWVQVQYYFPVQDEETAANCKRNTNLRSKVNARDVDTNKNSNWHRTRTEKKRKFQPKRLIVKFNATNVTFNSCICHYQVITCNMQR